MITITPLQGNLLKVEAPENLAADDFARIAPRVDEFIRQHGSIRLLVDATRLDGWENHQAFEQHMRFVKDHHQKVERAALLAGHAWQHWIVGAVKWFVTPELRCFGPGEEAEALVWLAGND